MTITTEPLDWKTYHNVIDGKLTSTAKTRNGIDPSTEEALPDVPVSTQKDVDDAVRAARAAFPAWAKLSWDEREGYLNKLADRIDANVDGFCDLLVKESGKAVSTAKMESGGAAAYLRGLASLRVETEEIPDVRDDVNVYARYNALGVGAGLVPWNWPLLLAIIKVGSALITGNTLIVKPSPFTPYSALKLVELSIGILPPGVLQVLSGGDDLGPMLTEHPDINKISFTGSTFTGKKVMESCARTLKRLTLELGGNDAAIICDDADIPKTVAKVGVLCFLSSGQICMDVKRVYVHEKVYDEFKGALLQFANAIKTGPADDPNVLVGPLQNAMQYGKVQDLYSEIKKQGWSVAHGGQESLRDTHAKGYFMQPTIIDNPPEDSRIVQEEPFGPIVPILKWSDEEDVIRRANALTMGLGGSVWTKDTKRGVRIAEQLEAGSVWVNTHFDLSYKVPFGGAKWSGLNRELGVDGLKGWLEPQSLWVMK